MYAQILSKYCDVNAKSDGSRYSSELGIWRLQISDLPRGLRHPTVDQSRQFQEQHEHNQFIAGELGGVSNDVRTCSPMSSYSFCCIAQHEDEEVVQRESHFSAV